MDSELRSDPDRGADPGAMRDKPIRMGDSYYRYPVGSADHYAAYADNFRALHGIDAAIPGDPESSYEADNAWELAYDRMVEEGAREAREEDEKWLRQRGVRIARHHLENPRYWLGDEWRKDSADQTRRTGPDIDREPS